MIAIKTTAECVKTQKVRCPECHGRICDVVVFEQKLCRRNYIVIFDENSDCLIAIKCHKCGEVIGLGITQ